jgi:hypothetical protein
VVPLLSITLLGCDDSANGFGSFPDEKRTRWREYAAAYEIQWDAILKQKLQACETGVEAPSLFFSELDKFELDSLQGRHYCLIRSRATD